jgi:Tn3 transposase DDE domain
MNKATCLSLLSNAVLVWNTVHMMRIIEQLRAGGETITPEELRRISPLAFSHVIPNGTYFTQHSTLEPEGDPHGPMNPVEVEVAADA